MPPRTRSVARKEEAGGAIFIGLPECVSELSQKRSLVRCADEEMDTHGHRSID